MRIQVIHSYDYRPEAIFYGDGPRYFGVELEIDSGGEDDDNAQQIMRKAGASCDTPVF